MNSLKGCEDFFQEFLHISLGLVLALMVMWQSLWKKEQRLG